MYPRARVLHAEQLVSNALKERAERKKQWANRLPMAARLHATAVAAILLAGEPKIDEPLKQAWTRALQHYDIPVGDKTKESEQVSAARQLFPIIVGQEGPSERFAEIFKSAPAWLLQFTRMTLDAWLLKFHLPEMTANSKWGCLGFKDSERWPLLPLGVMTAGEPIPDYDRRQLVLAILSVGPPSGSIPDFFDRPSEEEQNLSPVLEDLCFAISLEEKPQQEWSAYERRRMRRFVRRVSRDDGRDPLL